jgi:hypothetical protein
MNEANMNRTSFSNPKWDGECVKRNFDLICEYCDTRLGAHTGLVCVDSPKRSPDTSTPVAQSLSQRYPKYYKSVGELTEVDVYAVHQLFSLDDTSGCIHHASKKLLLSGVRTGGKTKQQDIREARDTLNRWLELNGEGM